MAGGLSGVADLPLHGGHVPAWMARLMKRLARAIVAVIVEEYGPGELVRRLADPLWFQAFNNAIGMDWDSSGSTTVTTGILREVLQENPGLGIAAAGGKGALARRVPEELPRAAVEAGVPDSVVEEALRASRIAAKTDHVLLQDGYTLYHHTVFASQDGAWTIVQQGMNVGAGMARRYHWSSPLPVDPTLEPHRGIAGAREKTVLDMTSRASIEARRVVVDLAREEPRRTLRLIGEAVRLVRGLRSIEEWLPGHRGAQEQRLPPAALEFYRRYYRPQARPPVMFEKVLRRVYELQPRNMRELLGVEGVGPSLVRSLALVAELIYGAEASHQDPVTAPLDPFRYAYIVGGKDGVPYPFNPELARRVVEFLEEAVEKAKLGDREKLRILARLRSLLPQVQP